MLWLSVAASAGEPPPDDLPAMATLGVDWASTYYFRGIPQGGAQGAIFQPALEVSARLFQSRQAELWVYVGFWSSVHSRAPAQPDGGAGGWYEADGYAGLDAVFGGALEVYAEYVAYTSPNGSFGNVHELDVGAQLDDGVWLRPRTRGIFDGLHPAMLVAGDLRGDVDLALRTNLYLEPSLTPTVNAVDHPRIGLRLGVPLVVSFVGDPELPGLFPAPWTGLLAELELRFLPQSMGLWTLGGGVQLYFTGERVAPVEPVGLVGLRLDL